MDPKRLESGPTLPPHPTSHRGAGINPANRFLSSRHELDLDNSDLDPADEPDPRTQFIADHSQSALTSNDSPDVGFDWSVNPYRGCEHGCAYCYARPTHEYLGYSAGLDFETKILIKHDAPELLRRELSKPSWKPAQVNLSGVTDCYQPIERKLRLTRRCLEVLAEFRNPVSIVTKNALVARDADVLGQLARYQAVAVFLSVTSLDPELRTKLEPRASPPAARLEAIRRLASAGIPVGVLIGPVIPAINDHEIPHILAAAVAAGASFASYNFLRLPGAVLPIFDDWLTRHFPDRKEKVLGQIRSFRDGAMNSVEFRERMRGTGAAADRLSQLFHAVCRRHGIDGQWPQPSAAHFRRVEAGQTELW